MLLQKEHLKEYINQALQGTTRTLSVLLWRITRNGDIKLGEPTFCAEYSSSRRITIL